MARRKYEFSLKYVIRSIETYNPIKKLKYRNMKIETPKFTTIRQCEIWFSQEISRLQIKGVTAELVEIDKVKR